MIRPRLPLLLLAVLAALPMLAGDPPPLDDPFLEALSGSWTLRGTVQGEAVVTMMEARWVLGHQFLRLHLVDAAEPPSYEALIFLGRDAGTGRYLAHWLDIAGAGPSRVLGTGTRTGDTLVLRFEYPGTTFRDTFTLDRAKGTWTLLIESGSGNGPWSTFAAYTAVRGTPD